MQPPTLVASYSSSYSTNSTPKTLSITTQAGDIVVVCGGGENQTATLSTPTGNSISFTTRQSIVVTSYATAYMWTGTDSTGGTNWTLSCGRTGGSGVWGYSCFVFRGSDGVGASSKTNVSNNTPSLGITTTQENSAIVVINADWNAQDGASRVWRTVNGITPTSGNGMEVAYYYGAGIWSAYAAYYTNAGTTGSKTVGLSSPGTQTYSIIALEVKGTATSKVSTISDDFSAPTMNSSLWWLMNGGGVLSQSTGQLAISPASNAPGYDGYASLATYNLTDSSIYIEIPQRASQSVGAETVFSLDAGSNVNSISMIAAQNGIVLRLRTSNSNSDTYISTYSSTLHRWWRIRGYYGNIYWETSPDCINWTTHRTMAPTFGLTSLSVVICAGTWQNVASPGQAIFDNLNVYGVKSLPIGWTKGS